MFSVRVPVVFQDLVADTIRLCADVHPTLVSTCFFLLSQRMLQIMSQGRALVPRSGQLQVVVMESSLKLTVCAAEVAYACASACFIRYLHTGASPDFSVRSESSDIPLRSVLLMRVSCGPGRHGLQCCV